MLSILFLCLLTTGFVFVDSKSKSCSNYYEDYSWWNYGEIPSTRCDMDYGPVEAPLDIDASSCPKIEKCSQIKDVPFTDCQSSNDCRRSEVCCQNPCQDKKQCLIRTKENINDNVYDSILKCPTTFSCSTLSLYKKNKKIRECDSNMDCKRTEICCKHTCDDLSEKICSRGEFIYPNPYPNPNPYPYPYPYSYY